MSSLSVVKVFCLCRNPAKKIVTSNNLHYKVKNLSKNSSQFEGLKDFLISICVVAICCIYGALLLAYLTIVMLTVHSCNANS